MPSLYKIVKCVYDMVVPVRWRPYLHNDRVAIGKMCVPILRLLERGAQHDEIYDRKYYQRNSDSSAARSFEVMARTLVDLYNPRSVIDVGCGAGGLLSAFLKHGLSVSGFEMSRAAIALCKERGIPVTRCDLELRPIFHARADLVVSTEVAEHLPDSLAEYFVSVLTSIAPVVVLTAAPPGQGGHDHVNEQPPAYWIAKFKSLGYEHQVHAWEQLKKSWQDGGVLDIYVRNGMIFKRDVAHGGLHG